MSSQKKKREPAHPGPSLRILAHPAFLLIKLLHGDIHQLIACACGFQECCVPLLVDLEFFLDKAKAKAACLRSHKKSQLSQKLEWLDQMPLHG